MKRFKRIIIIGVVSLLAGVLTNQLHREGIPWRLLALSFSSANMNEAWRPVSTDSSFVHFMRQSAVFVDLRPQDKYTLDHIPGARSCPFFNFFKNPSIFPDDKNLTYILYCFEPMCKEARIMGQQLIKEGYTQVLFIRNGYKEWLEKTFPVESGAGP
ncbi:hypothetical protein BVY01_03595 [bacterium I07]|nr:hypothetical protein BVY01_03595 [bacterium I07]